MTCASDGAKRGTKMRARAASSWGSDAGSYSEMGWAGKCHIRRTRMFWSRCTSGRSVGGLGLTRKPLLRGELEVPRAQSLWHVTPRLPMALTPASTTGHAHTQEILDYHVLNSINQTYVSYSQNAPTTELIFIKTSGLVRQGIRKLSKRKSGSCSSDARTNSLIQAARVPPNNFPSARYSRPHKCCPNRVQRQPCNCVAIAVAFTSPSTFDLST